MSKRRDIAGTSEAESPTGLAGRRIVAAIGIDRYQGWQRLTNAVSDARGALKLFGQLGFEQVTAPLLDAAATSKAIRELVEDDLSALGAEDSLILFYAGHGGTRTHRPGNQEVKTGYLIPVDASDRVSTWIKLDAWLHAVSLLSAKHILVILDACQSGIALGPIIRWRDDETSQDTPLATLRARRSRRIITSALDDQRALDSGPVYGHSLFTGCLIEGLTHGFGDREQRVITGGELGLYLQRRVATYPNSRQTPDSGRFDHDDRGELVIPLVDHQPAEPIATALPMLAATATAAPAPSSQPPEGTTMGQLVVTAVSPPPVESDEPPSSSVGGDDRADASERDDEASTSIEAPSPLSVSVRMRRWLVWGGVGAAAVFALVLSYGYSPSRQDATPLDAVVPYDAEAGASNRRADAGATTTTPPDAPASCSRGMVHVPAGTFQMGSPAGEGEAEEHPQHEVTLSGYCLDETEVTVRAYEACVAAKECSAARRSVKWSGYNAEEVKTWSRYCNGSDRPEHPMNCVDWDQAAAYCRWVDKRLPTEAEWENAARGGGWRYPWANDEPSAQRLNACGTECVEMAKQDLKVDWHSMYNTSDGWETTAPVGSFRQGASLFGVLDMAGNVWEWTADWYGGYSANEVANPSGAKTGTSRVLRGGGWVSRDAARVRAAYRGRNVASYRNNDVGFRCARGD